ncbi:MAG: hypothetical protein DI539_06570 [Flavobacterium psychrophilum]|nr:MAG: hypothetical protein DI539_06570 [Flavobacterium psychrophilum]
MNDTGHGKREIVLVISFKVKEIYAMLKGIYFVNLLTIKYLMKTTFVYLILCIAIFTSCKNEINHTEVTPISETAINESDSIKLEKYFQWYEKHERTGYKEYDTLTLQKIESEKDTIILNTFISEHPEILQNYEYEDNPSKKLLEHLHLIDINGDNKNDIVFQGYWEGEPQITQLFIQSNNGYRKIFTQYQYIHSLVFKDKKLTSFKMANPGCCADPQFVEHEYIVSYSDKFSVFKLNKSIGYYIGMEKPKHKFDSEKEFNITVNNAALRVDSYILDNVEHPMYGPGGNVISKYKKATKGKAIAYKTEGDKSWIYAIMPLKDGFSFYDFNEQKGIPSYTYGWILKSDTDLK